MFFGWTPWTGIVLTSMQRTETKKNGMSQLNTKKERIFRPSTVWASAWRGSSNCRGLRDGSSQAPSQYLPGASNYPQRREDFTPNVQARCNFCSGNFGAAGFWRFPLPCFPHQAFGFSFLGWVGSLDFNFLGRGVLKPRKVKHFLQRGQQQPRFGAGLYVHMFPFLCFEMESGFPW